MDLANVKSARAAWTDALRSGQYQQGAGAMRRNDKYCCLGVAADLAVRAQLATWTHDALVFEQRSIEDRLPDGLARLFDVVHNQAVLIQANDTGVSFARIADYLDGFITERELLEPPCGL